MYLVPVNEVPAKYIVIPTPAVIVCVSSLSFIIIMASPDENTSAGTVTPPVVIATCCPTSFILKVYDDEVLIPGIVEPSKPDVP